MCLLRVCVLRGGACWWRCGQPGKGSTGGPRKGFLLFTRNSTLADSHCRCAAMPFVKEHYVFARPQDRGNVLVLEYSKMSVIYCCMVYSVLSFAM